MNEIPVRHNRRWGPTLLVPIHNPSLFQNIKSNIIVVLLINCFQTYYIRDSQICGLFILRRTSAYSATWTNWRTKQSSSQGCDCPLSMRISNKQCWLKWISWNMSWNQTMNIIQWLNKSSWGKCCRCWGWRRWIDRCSRCYMLTFCRLHPWRSLLVGNGIALSH